MQFIIKITKKNETKNKESSYPLDGKYKFKNFRK